MLRIILSFLGGLLLIVLYILLAITVVRLWPHTLLTTDIFLYGVEGPPPILLPVTAPMIFYMWLGPVYTKLPIISTVAFRFLLTFIPVILVYSSIVYFLLGSLKWFRKKPLDTPVGQVAPAEI
jgi:hypothetical protein